MPQQLPDLKILPAEEHQLPMVLSFIRKLAEYERLSDEVVADGDMLRRFLFGEKPAAEAVLAWLGDRPAGFAIFFTTFSTFVGRPGIYLEDLFVDVDLRGRGIGKALLRHLAQVTIDRGYARLEWAVLDWNQPSIDFYCRLGAKPLGDWTQYRLTDQALQALAAKETR